MTTDEKTKKLEPLFEGQDVFTLKSVEEINHSPHPFCIGPEHIERYTVDTTKGCAMYVDDDGHFSTTRKPGYHKCGLSYEQHTKQFACFIQLKRHATNQEANDVLGKILAEMPLGLIDGFVFVETDEKFRIE